MLTHLLSQRNVSNNRVLTLALDTSLAFHPLPASSIQILADASSINTTIIPAALPMTGKMSSKGFTEIIYLDGRERERRCQKDGSACESVELGQGETPRLLGQSDERIRETKESHKAHAEQMVGRPWLCRVTATLPDMLELRMSRMPTLLLKKPNNRTSPSPFATTAWSTIIYRP